MTTTRRDAVIGGAGGLVAGVLLALAVVQPTACELQVPAAFTAEYRDGAVHFGWAPDPCARLYMVWRDGSRLWPLAQPGEAVDQPGSGTHSYRVGSLPAEFDPRDGPLSEAVLVVVP